MKSSTELVSATSEAAFRLVQRNIEEKGKPDRYAIGAMDGYLQGYCDGVVDNINLEKACEWLKRELADPMPDELYQRWCEEKLADFRKAMLEE